MQRRQVWTIETRSPDSSFVWWPVSFFSTRGEASLAFHLRALNSQIDDMRLLDPEDQVLMQHERVAEPEAGLHDMGVN